ncbi:MAG: hypothetical protein NVS4B11_13910 [Ktedonobacteraceae bacterium]
MPTSDAQPSNLRPQIILPTHSIPSSSVPQVPDVHDAVLYPTPSTTPLAPPQTSLPMRPATTISAAEQSENISYEHAIDFATHSWDLKTGGLKTLTAKREFPTRLDRRPSELLQDSHESSSTRNYIFAMIVLVCVIFMLLGGGVILFVMLQP